VPQGHVGRSGDDAEQMLVTTVEISRKLGARAGAWDALVDRMPHPSPFLRSWWLDALRGPGAAFVLALDDAGALVGGVPLELDRRRGVKRCRLIGSGSLAPHNLELVAAVGREPDVLDAFDTFLAQSRPGIVDLFGLDPESALARHAAPSARCEQIGAAPWIDVPTDFETYVDSRRRKLRQEIRRVQRRLGEAGMTYREVGPADAERALDTFEALHRRRWGHRSVVLSELTVLSGALEAGARRGEVVFQEVLAGDQVIASLVAFDVGGRSSWYQMGRDPDPRWTNCGTLLKARAVERSCRLGHSRIDLCIGTARQKVEWSDGQQPVVRVRWARGTAERAALRGLVALGHLAESARARRAAALTTQ
jgi:CelD/BcsL family acetyltransferase involved in cellulose biosynthesis